MKFDFENPPALVEQKKKTTTFTIREIGGPAEIIKWRQMQEAKEWAYRMRLAQRDERISEAEKSMGTKFNSPTVTGHKESSWADKMAFIAAEKKEIAEMAKRVEAHPPWIIEPEPKKSIFKKLSEFFGRIWKNANF